MSSEKAVVVYSGGLDSTVLLHGSLRRFDKVKALSVDYGQRHSKELEYARRECSLLGVEHRVLDLRNVRELLAGSSQTSDTVDVPNGHYAEESMKLTVVPNRNMILLSLAIGWAVSVGYSHVAFGAHAGDRAIYPDCRSEFAEKLAAVAAIANWSPVALHAPFLAWGKTDIVLFGRELGVDFASTWSCYRGEEIHCGQCGTCVERREAFMLAGVLDPTTYAVGIVLR